MEGNPRTLAGLDGAGSGISGGGFYRASVDAGEIYLNRLLPAQVPVPGRNKAGRQNGKGRFAHHRLVRGAGFGVYITGFRCRKQSTRINRKLLSACLACFITVNGSFHGPDP